ncbi:GNAT family N-acetyltransferase [Halostella litorea]|uniref:GNAT family N-acetyltransferase n=1 Tax=Halostella litorea TaxID=2528831 RepID=UPI001092FDB7|nr:GNAT family N-acetyltransferase [Halostella litorea]
MGEIAPQGGTEPVADGASCDRWHPTDCEGTAHCPPRCPRFVDRQDVAWLVRPFEPADREPLLDMYREFDSMERAQGIPPVDEGRLERWVDRLVAEGCNFVAVRDGRIAGHSVYTPTEEDEPELAVFVHQEYQGRGLGTELCRHVVAAAAAAGRDALVLEVLPSNRTAVGIYERLGFEPVERRGGAGRRSHAMRMRLPFEADGPHGSQFPPAVRG